jgi:uncharacterized protein YjiS (DUF1127 family)
MRIATTNVLPAIPVVSLAGLLVRVRTAVAAWVERDRERREISLMDRREMRDLLARGAEVDRVRDFYRR